MNKPLPNSFRQGPDARGRFGPYGGRFVAETLMPLILEVEKAYEEAKRDPAFMNEWRRLLTHYVGRPSPLWLAERLTQKLGGAKIYFKRDELNHTGAHKINAVLGQIMLAKRMGKTRIIAETGAGQHGVATATACALFDLPCTVFMGATDVERQQPNVFRMKLLGAEVVPVTSGAATLKDAMNEGLRDWVANVEDTFYCIGTVAGPHPYPEMVRDFQSVIGKEAKYVSVEEAMSHIAGYCIANDVSERDFQLRRSGQWVKGKSADTFGPIGPWLVTRDEIANPQDLKMTLDVNGKRFQDGSTKTMHFSVAEVVSYLSQFMSLQPGDVISTGTPPGVGMGQKPEVYLKAGDQMVLAIEGLGEQRYEVVQG